LKLEHTETERENILNTWRNNYCKWRNTGRCGFLKASN